MFRSVIASFQQGFRNWVNRRIKAARTITLGQRNLFIFPAASGWAYIFTVLLLWVLGTNYENALILALAFLLLSVFVVAILHTYHNLAGLRLTLAEAQPVFAGERAAFRVRLARKAGSTKGQVLSIGWRDEMPVSTTLEGDEQDVELWAQSHRRGWLRPGRLKLESFFPMGIIRCWTWLDLDARALVYPKPVASDQAPWADADGELDAHFQRAGSDDFVGLESYQPGQSLKRIAWKQFARGQGLLLKQFAQSQGQAQALDWDFFEGLDTEGRLARLCYWVLYLDQRGLAFSLALPGQKIAMGLGDAHRERCLRALALFGSDAVAGTRAGSTADTTADAAHAD
ncbi:DUF58 domain-containing protein [Simiduia sp. 21SJ11W-1]|uniref:DUF58 domain-containing protein n=1 Tax=Simiduia sp. 21SJ11W-1 TaxID=2909669 RepID=UPI00209D8F4A|nr:DUF58 domain-containing protein [Simiduia sp. 21SJ11W-1]UTA49291.1 DUF58 domain-containing protein [Simiduia sp. 21SJ11W-1]